MIRCKSHLPLKPRYRIDPCTVLSEASASVGERLPRSSVTRIGISLGDVRCSQPQ
jgi:hypothetical protein